jgi:hypothetical protein
MEGRSWFAVVTNVQTLVNTLPELVRLTAPYLGVGGWVQGGLQLKVNKFAVPNQGAENRRTSLMMPC